MKKNKVKGISKKLLLLIITIFVFFVFLPNLSYALNFVSISLNGQNLDTSNPVLTVNPGQKVSGAVVIEVSKGCRECDAPVIAARSWEGNKYDCIAEGATMTAWSGTYRLTYSPSFSVPSQGGTYYLGVFYGLFIGCGSVAGGVENANWESYFSGSPTGPYIRDGKVIKIVAKPSSSLIISSTSDTIESGKGGVRLNATLKDANGNPISGKKIEWDVGQKLPKPFGAPCTTNDQGKCTVELSAHIVYSEETHKIKAYFSGDDAYSGVTSSELTMRVVPERPPNVDAEISKCFLSKTSVQAGESTQINVEIRNTGNVPANFKIKTIVQGKETFYPNVINVNNLYYGQASGNDVIWKADASSGNYLIKAQVWDEALTKMYEEKDCGYLSISGVSTTTTIRTTTTLPKTTTTTISTTTTTSSNAFYTSPTSANQNKMTKLQVVVDLTKISMKEGCPVQWYVKKPNGQLITGERDKIKCCFAGGLFDDATYNFPDTGKYKIKVDFLPSSNCNAYTVEWDVYVYPITTTTAPKATTTRLPTTTTTSEPPFGYFTLFLNKKGYSLSNGIFYDSSNKKVSMELNKDLLILSKFIKDDISNRYIYSIKPVLLDNKKYTTYFISTRDDFSYEQNEGQFISILLDDPSVKDESWFRNNGITNIVVLSGGSKIDDEKILRDVYNSIRIGYKLVWGPHQDLFIDPNIKALIKNADQVMNDPVYVAIFYEQSLSSALEGDIPKYTRVIREISSLGMTGELIPETLRTGIRTSQTIEEVIEATRSAIESGKYSWNERIFDAMNRYEENLNKLKQIKAFEKKVGNPSQIFEFLLVLTEQQTYSDESVESLKIIAKNVKDNTIDINSNLTWSISEVIREHEDSNNQIIYNMIEFVGSEAIDLTKEKLAEEIYKEFSNFVIRKAGAKLGMRILGGLNQVSLGLTVSNILYNMDGLYGYAVDTSYSMKTAEEFDKIISMIREKYKGRDVPYYDGDEIKLYIAAYSLKHRALSRFYDSYGNAIDSALIIKLSRDLTSGGKLSEDSTKIHQWANEFNALVYEWIHPKNMQVLLSMTKLEVIKSICGNGECEFSENCKSCSEDCGKCMTIITGNVVKIDPVGLKSVSDKLEDVKNKFNKLEDLLVVVTNYYKSTGDTSKSSSWNSILEKLSDLNKKLDTIESQIKQVKIPEDVSSIKSQFTDLQKDISDLIDLIESMK